MKVAIDARRLQDRPPGGVGRSLTGVLDALAREVDVVLLTDARRGPVSTDLHQVALPVPRRAPETVWLQWSVPRFLRDFDGIFHGTFNAVPLRAPVPTVVTVHDLSWEVHAEDFTRAKRRAFRLQARHACKIARRVIVPSAHTRRELFECYRVPPERVVVTPWAVDPRFGPANAAGAPAVCARLGVTGRYVVAIGGARRRGLDTALAAWRRVRANGVDGTLVVVGATALPPDAGLVAAGRLDDEEWAALLAGADALCYPTRYEGFGFPALESAASGTPVVCAPVASLPEVLGAGAQWCDAPTVDAIASGLHRVLTDPARAAELRRAGLDHVAGLPGWEYTAAETLRAYRETALAPAVP